MKRISFPFFGGLLLALAGLFSGCGFFGINGVEEVLAPAPVTTGPANVSFKVVLPDRPEQVGTAIPAIRANGLSARVIIRLILVTPGTSGQNTTILTKTVDVVDGQVSASFNGVPPQTVIGEFSIENGNIAGKSDFHGASDLNSGDNVLEVSPKGSGHRSDIVANVVLAVIHITAVIQNSPANLVSAIESAAATEISQGGGGAYNDVLNSFLTRGGIAPGTFARLTVGLDGSSLSGDGVPVPWMKTSAQIWNGTDFESAGFKVQRVLRQGFGGFAYVSWVNPAGTQFAITRLDATSGALLKRIVSQGPGRMAMVLQDDSILVGGSLDSLPFLFRWDGKTDATLDSGSAGTFANRWAHSFTELTKNATVMPNPMVEYLELPVVVGGDFLCVARDPLSGQGRSFRVNPESGSPTEIGATVSLALWATPGDGNAVLGWDPLPGTQTYTLYWHTADSVSETDNLGALPAVTTPFAHHGRQNGTAYFYLLKAVSGTGAKVLSKVVRCTPRAVTPSGSAWTLASSSAAFPARGLAAGAWFNDRMWVIGGMATPAGFLNDVWSSADGQTWTVASPAAGFSGRSYHTVLVQGGKIHVIGGAQGPGALLNDVWSSPNGTTWTQTTAGAGFSKRIGQGGLVFNNKMWILGGYDGAVRNDVWSSSDGANWEKILDAASFSARIFPAVTVFDGKMWLAGGCTESGGPGLNDVWSSPDGASWTKIVEVPAFRSRVWGSLLAVGGRLWFLGGQSGNEYRGEALLSPNGVDWVSSEALGGFPGRTGEVTLVQGNRIWVIGGERDYQLLNDVWYSRQIAAGDNLPPMVTLINPASGTTVQPPISVMADAKDVDGSVTRVDFYAGPNKIGEVIATQPPFIVSWTPVATGAFSLTARATDNLGAVRTSEPVPVTVSLATGPRIVRSTTTGGDWTSAATWVGGVVPTGSDSVVIDGRVTLTRSGIACSRLEISPTGRLEVNQWDPGITIDGSVYVFGTLISTYDTHFYVKGDLENFGTITRTSFSYPNIYLDIGLYGNLVHKGDAFIPNWFGFMGTQPQHITLGDGKVLGGPFSDTNPASPLIADTDLSFGWIQFDDSGVTGQRTLDMQGHKLTFNHSYARFNDFKIVNCPQVFAAVDMELGTGRGNWFFENHSFPLHLAGRSIWMVAGVTVEGDLFIDSGVKIFPIFNSGTGNLTVTGNLTNDGSIQTWYESNSGRLINILLGGNLTNNGDWRPNETYFNGTSAQTITWTSDQKMSGNFWDLTPGTPTSFNNDVRINGANFRVPSDATASPTLELNGHRLFVQGTNRFSEHQIRNCPEVVVEQDADFNNQYGVPHFINPSFPLHFKGTGTNLGITMRTSVDGDLIVDSGLRVYSINESGRGDMHIRGSFTNNGTVETWDSGNNGVHINFMITGDFAQNATYVPNETYFIGANPQYISVASNAVLSGNYWDNIPTSALVAKTDLRLTGANFRVPSDATSSPTLDLAGHRMVVKGQVQFQEFWVKDCSEVLAVEDSTFMNGFGAPHFVNAAPVHFKGNGTRLGITMGTSVDGDLVIDQGANVYAINETGRGDMHIRGNFTNNGSLETRDTGNNGMHINFLLHGNLTQNGSYLPNETRFVGTTDQRISVGPGAFLTRYFWDTTPESPLVAQTALSFKDSALKLGTNTASGTLDMNGMELAVESQLIISSATIANLSYLSASGGASLVTGDSIFNATTIGEGATMTGRFYLSGTSRPESTTNATEFLFHGKVGVASGSLITTVTNHVYFNTDPAGNLTVSPYARFYSAHYSAGGWPADALMFVNGSQQAFVP